MNINERNSINVLADLKMAAEKVIDTLKLPARTIILRNTLSLNRISNARSSVQS